MSSLTRQEILRLVNNYIGVDNGYLCDFSYRSHQEFYPYYCGLDIDPLTLENKTTKERFIYILENASPKDQAKILRGTLAKIPPSNDNPNRTLKMAQEITSWAQRCESIAIPGSLMLSITSDVVERAIADAEVLIRENGATSGIDRVHTTLHGYLIAICDEANIPHKNDSDITDLFKLLRQHHPKLQPSGSRAEDITKMLRALSNIVDVMNPLRNKASVAHPNQDLLDEEEAWLVINAARVLIKYIDRKIS